MWTGLLFSNYWVPLTVQSNSLYVLSFHPHDSPANKCMFVVPILQSSNVKLRTVKALTQGHCCGDGNFGIQAQNVWVQGMCLQTSSKV